MYESIYRFTFMPILHEGFCCYQKESQSLCIAISKYLRLGNLKRGKIYFPTVLGAHNFKRLSDSGEVCSPSKMIILTLEGRSTMEHLASLFPFYSSINIGEGRGPPYWTEGLIST